MSLDNLDKLKNVQRFFDEFMGDWEKKEIFISAYQAAQTAALYIDISCRMHFKVKTGNLARSFEAVPAKRKGKLITAGAYSPQPYAAIRERGGTIRPKRKKALAIPVSKVGKNVGSPAMWSGPQKLVYIPRPKGGGNPRSVGLLGVPTKNGAFKAHFALRSSVTQTGSGYLAWAQKMAQPEISKIVGDSITKAWATVNVPGVEK